MAHWKLTLALAVCTTLPVAAQAQAPASAHFPACPSLAAIQAAGGVPAGTSFPCMAIATFVAGADASFRGDAVARAGAAARFDLGRINGTAVFVPNARALDALAASPGLLQLYPDRIKQAIAGPAAPGGNKPGGGTTTGQVIPPGVLRIGANTVWGTTATPGVTGAGVKVAIVDTGIDFGHTDLDPAAECFFPVPSALNIDACDDDHGHGTHVAGIVAALNNSQDVVGVAPGAIPVAVKVLDAAGYGYDSEIVAGLQWVIGKGISVVNMSLGGDLAADETCAETVYQDAITALNGAGIVVVVAAGNDRTKTIAQLAPAGCDGVISVASTLAEAGTNKCIFNSAALPKDTASYFTTNGARIAAPGGRNEDWGRGCTGKLNGIQSLKLGGGTTTMSGTSMASPHVAGVAALLFDAGADAAATTAALACTYQTASGATVPYPHPLSGATGASGKGILSAPLALDCLP